jgi:predicted DNA-binding transcriptional regulator AlpA
VHTVFQQDSSDPVLSTLQQILEAIKSLEQNSVSTPFPGYPYVLHYDHLEQITGINRRTIQRLMSRKRFPRPGPTGGWSQSIIKDYLDNGGKTNSPR